MVPSSCMRSPTSQFLHHLLSLYSIPRHTLGSSQCYMATRCFNHVCRGPYSCLLYTSVPPTYRCLPSLKLTSPHHPWATLPAIGSKCTPAVSDSCSQSPHTYLPIWCHVTGVAVANFIWWWHFCFFCQLVVPPHPLLNGTECYSVTRDHFTGEGMQYKHNILHVWPCTQLYIDLSPLHPRQESLPHIASLIYTPTHARFALNTRSDPHTTQCIALHSIFYILTHTHIPSLLLPSLSAFFLLSLFQDWLTSPYNSKFTVAGSHWLLWDP